MNIQSPPGEINTSEPVSVMELKTPVVLLRTSLIKKWRVIMKNIVLASLLGFGLISSAWATETVNIHERVNNAQARKRKLTAVCSHQTRIGNLDAHLI